MGCAGGDVGLLARFRSRPWPAIGSFAGPNSWCRSSIRLPAAAFASGMWIPIQVLPPVVKSLGALAAVLSLGPAGAGPYRRDPGRGHRSDPRRSTLPGSRPLPGLALDRLGYRTDEIGRRVSAMKPALVAVRSGRCRVGPAHGSVARTTSPSGPGAQAGAIRWDVHRPRRPPLRGTARRGADPGVSSSSTARCCRARPWWSEAASGRRAGRRGRLRRRAGRRSGPDAAAWPDRRAHPRLWRRPGACARLRRHDRAGHVHRPDAGRGLRRAAGRTGASAGRTSSRPARWSPPRAATAPSTACRSRRRVVPRTQPPSSTRASPRAPTTSRSSTTTAWLRPCAGPRSTATLKAVIGAAARARDKLAVVHVGTRAGAPNPPLRPERRLVHIFGDAPAAPDFALASEAAGLRDPHADRDRERDRRGQRGGARQRSRPRGDSSPRPSAYGSKAASRRPGSRQDLDTCRGTTKIALRRRRVDPRRHRRAEPRHGARGEPAPRARAAGPGWTVAGRGARRRDIGAGSRLRPARPWPHRSGTARRSGARRRRSDLGRHRHPATSSRSGKAAFDSSGRRLPRQLTAAAAPTTTGLVSTFEAGEVSAEFGSGWQVSTDA